MNRRQRKKQQTIAKQKACQSTSSGRYAARQQRIKNRVASNKFDRLLVKVASRLSEIKTIISNYDIKVNRLANEIEGAYGVDPLLANWANGSSLQVVQSKLDEWWDKFGFNSQGQYYDNLQKAISVTGIEFEIINEFREIVEDCFQATNNVKAWSRLTYLEWQDKVTPVFQASEQEQHKKALNARGIERHTGSGLEAFLAL